MNPIFNPSLTATTATFSNYYDNNDEPEILGVVRRPPSMMGWGVVVARAGDILTSSSYPLFHNIPVLREGGIDASPTCVIVVGMVVSGNMTLTSQIQRILDPPPPLSALASTSDSSSASASASALATSEESSSAESSVGGGVGGSG